MFGWFMCLAWPLALVTRSCPIPASPEYLVHGPGGGTIIQLGPSDEPDPGAATGRPKYVKRADFRVVTRFSYGCLIPVGMTTGFLSCGTWPSPHAALPEYRLLRGRRSTTTYLASTNRSPHDTDSISESYPDRGSTARTEALRGHPHNEAGAQATTQPRRA